MEISPSSYVEILRTWRSGDTINMDLPIPVRRVECHPYVTENTGRVALMRGPLLYCVEQADNLGVDLRDLVLEDATFSARFDPELLGGVVLLVAEVRAAAPDDGWEDRLYRTSSPRGSAPRPGTTTLKTLPY